ncbi:MAG TPA: hypothetical protein VMH32_14985 [Burkholderiales bacterium]|nr:hypothetical protein [Burkholderiales bacterium]
MSVSGPSPAINLYIRGSQSEQAYGFKQRQPQLVSLSQALSTGDLSAARSAFSALQQDIQAAPQAQNGQPAAANAQNSVVGALQALGQALTSGNIPAAQTAFTTLQQNLQNAGQAHHHHHHRTGGGQGGSSSSVSATSAAPTSTINVKA